MISEWRYSSLVGNARMLKEDIPAKRYYTLFSESGFDDRITVDAACNPSLQLYTLEQIVNYKYIMISPQKKKCQIL